MHVSKQTNKISRKFLVLIFIFLGFFLSSCITYADTTTGLVGWWKLDETSGASAYDSSGCGYTGTLQNSPTRILGKKAGALSFTGASSQYVSVSGSSVNGLSTITISAWVMWSGTQETAPFGNPGAISGRQWNFVGNNLILALDGTNPSTSHVNWCPRVYAACVTGTTIVGDGVWRHVVGVDDGTNAYLYIDGRLEVSGAPDNRAFMDNAGISFTIGAWIGDGASFMTGRIDDVRVYNRALTAQDVYMLYLSDNRIRGNAAVGNVQFK